MLEELSKHHNKWLSIAYNICKCDILAKDLTQDMYLKMYESDKKYEEINEWYVWVTIRNIYYNQLKKKKIQTISIEVFHNIEDILSSDETLKTRLEVNAALNELDLWDREILLHTSEMSLRDLSKETGISVMTLFHNKHNALKKLKDKL